MSTEKKNNNNYRNLSCEITNSVLSLGENSVFTLEHITYTEREEKKNCSGPLGFGNWNTLFQKPPLLCTSVVCKEIVWAAWWPQPQPRTCGMNWMVDYELGLIHQHQWPTSLTLQLQNGSKSLQPGSVRNLSKDWTQKSGGCYSSQWFWNWLLSSHIRIMFGCL